MLDNARIQRKPRVIMLLTMTREDLFDRLSKNGVDEFAVVFPGAEARTAAGVMERVRQAVNSHAVLMDLSVTLSTGVAQYSGEELSGFIDEADKKLYEAKHSGKDKVEA